MQLIDAVASLTAYWSKSSAGPEVTPYLHWNGAWAHDSGQGITAGLLDGDFDESLADFRHADLITRDFCQSRYQTDESIAHGTHSVATLLAQGAQAFRGLAPDSRLLVAKVVHPRGIASIDAVLDALEWVIEGGATIVALPLGQAAADVRVSKLLTRCASEGVVVFAAAGNGYPEPVMFPACHSQTISVAGADRQGVLLPDCSRLPTVDLIAPGDRVAAPVGRGRIGQRSGTSVACLLAAGAAIRAVSCGLLATPTRDEVLRKLHTSHGRKLPCTTQSKSAPFIRRKTL